MGAVAAVVLLFVPGMTSFKWKDLQKEIDWAGIILIAAGISLGMTLYQTGAAAWLSAVLLGGIGSLPLFIRLVLIVLAVLAVKIAFSSNTLTGTIIVPLVLALGPRLGTGATGLALAAGFTANLAIILVTTSPVNIIPYTTGYFSIKDMAIAGLILTPLAALIIALVFSILGPAIGIL
jgi:sodium-dependent dicarboxylate transporter 2/3/5